MSKIYKLSELDRGMIGIYKINFPNGKIYIGLSVDIKRRIWEHNLKHETVCDKAIQKYGKIEEIEILELCDKSELKEKEKYWIKYFDATNREKGYNISEGGDTANRSDENSFVAVFTNEQVLDIRKRRFEGERKKDVYKDYEQFSFASFENIWLGRGYSSVGQEYYIEPHSISRQEYSSKANSGLKNGRAKLTREQILDIRNRADSGEQLISIHKDYNFVSNSTIGRVARRQVYKDVK